MRATNLIQLILSVGGFCALCWDAGMRLPERYPGAARLQADPARYAGREVWIGPAKVVESSTELFLVQTSQARVTIRSGLRPVLGVHALVRGISQKDGSVQELVTMIDTRWTLERVGVY